MFRMDSSIALSKNRRQYFNGLAGFLGVRDGQRKDYPGVKAYAHYLFNLDLMGFEPRDFPLTDFLAEQKRCSMPTAHEWWDNCLVRGAVLPDNEMGDLKMATDHDWEVERDLLHLKYQNWCRDNNIRSKRSDIPNRFYKSLNQITGSTPVRTDRVTKRQYVTLPRLSEARQHMRRHYPGFVYDVHTEPPAEAIARLSAEIARLTARKEELERMPVDLVNQSIMPMLVDDISAAPVIPDGLFTPAPQVAHPNGYPPASPPASPPRLDVWS
jgi:hypothetical protein